MPTNQKIFVSLIGCVTIGFGAALGFVVGVKLCEAAYQAWKARTGKPPDSSSSQEIQLLTSEYNSKDLSENEFAQDASPVEKKDINMKVQMEIRKRPV